jgi:uncharacterized membrane protein YiaA
MNSLTILGYLYLVVGALAALIGLLNSSRQVTAPIVLASVAVMILLWPLAFAAGRRKS